MTKYRFLEQILLHILVWFLLFMLNYFFLKNYPVVFNFNFHITTWLIYIVIFYINYLFLIPKFLFKNKFIIYTFSVVVLISASYLVRQKIFEKTRFELQQQFRQEQFKSQFPGPMHPDDRPYFRRQRFFDDRRPPRPRINLISLYGLLMVYAISTILALIKRWNDTEKQKIEMEKEKLQSEIKYLKQQINPHFLFNSLNNIYSLALTKSDLTTEAIIKLSAILRYMIYESQKEKVPMQEELNLIINYIDLQKLRMNEKTILNFQIEGDPDSYLIEPLLLIPIIENCFEYGCDNINESFIDINIKIQNSTLDLNTKNKIVQLPETKTTSKGLGLKNLKRRLELLYPNNFEFSTQQKDNIFEVKLKIDLKQ